MNGTSYLPLGSLIFGTRPQVRALKGRFDMELTGAVTLKSPQATTLGRAA